MVQKKNMVWLVLLLFALSGCAKNNAKPLCSQENISVTETATTEAVKTTEAEDADKKGYNLPINAAKKKEAEDDCLKAAALVKDLYLENNKEGPVPLLSETQITAMMDQLEQTGNPVYAEGYHLNMRNYGKMEAFLEQASAGKQSTIVMYEAHGDGGVGRDEYTFDGKNFYVLYSNVVWKQKDTPTVAFTSLDRIKNWSYTQKGWLCLDYCVPEPPEVTELVNGNVMVRVKPQKEEYRDMAEKYLVPIGYQGNNLLCSDWDEAHMQDLDYTGLFEYLYALKNRRPFDAESSDGTIPAGEFESLMEEYLPVTTKQLRQYANYDAKADVYEWAKLGCGNYAPNDFGTAYSEITDIKENADKTVTFTVDAVCAMKGDDAVMSHQLTVQLLEGGGVRYLENHILEDGQDRIPGYQYRLKKERDYNLK